LAKANKVPDESAAARSDGRRPQKILLIKRRNLRRRSGFWTAPAYPRHSSRSAHEEQRGTSSRTLIHYGTGKECTNSELLLSLTAAKLKTNGTPVVIAVAMPNAASGAASMLNSRTNTPPG